MKKIALLTLALAFLSGGAMASGGEAELPHQAWPFKGFGGTYDQAALQRGLKVYREVCSGCHSLKRVYFRNLQALGYDEDQVKTIASEYTVVDGPDAEGEMFERAARPSDAFPSPYANEQEAAAINGVAPPDLSLMTKARHDGPNYVYGLLTGFGEAEHGVEIPEGKYYNEYFAGHVISMAPPLDNGLVSYADGTPETLEQYAYDVVNFLNWAADPYMEERKRTGIKVILFLLAFAGVMYAYKKRIWADLH